MRTCPAVFAAGLVLAISVAASTTTVNYTFESPYFTVGEKTPLLDRPANIGGSGFRASFTASPTANGIMVTTFAASPYFSGQNLMNPFPPDPGNALSVALNQPVNHVEVDFSLMAMGRLELTSAAGATSAYNSTSAQWGHPSFVSNAGFADFTLRGFDQQNQAAPLAIDNLVLTVVPEPSAVSLLLLPLAVGLALGPRRGWIRRG